MAGRLVVVMISFLAAVVGFNGSARAELRPSVERPDVIEVGDPVMIGKATLDREMRLNVNLDEHIELYGRPDYAEIQEVQVQEPFASYEVRIYYLRRNSYLAFGRVAVAPSVFDYGVRKYEGPIRPETLDRLLTAVVTPADEAEEAEIVEIEAPQAAVVAVETEVPVQEAAAVEAEVVEAEALEAVEPMEPAEPVEVAAASEGSGRTLEEIISRLEAAADRAAAAATMAEEASIAATSSADRATSALERVAREAGQ
jgi:hypothetical protein